MVHYQGDLAEDQLPDIQIILSADTNVISMRDLNVSNGLDGYWEVL